MHLVFYFDFSSGGGGKKRRKTSEVNWRHKIVHVWYKLVKLKNLHNEKMFTFVQVIKSIKS